MYDQYSRAVSNQERVIVARVWYFKYTQLTPIPLLTNKLKEIAMQLCLHLVQNTPKSRFGLKKSQLQDFIIRTFLEARLGKKCLLGMLSHEAFYLKFFCVVVHSLYSFLTNKVHRYFQVFLIRPNGFRKGPQYFKGKFQNPSNFSISI